MEEYKINIFGCHFIKKDNQWYLEDEKVDYPWLDELITSLKKIEEIS